MMRRMSADNHRGHEAKTFHKQAGYMRAMISSYINDQMSCKRSGFIYAGGRTNQDEYRTYSVENVRNKFSRQSRGSLVSATLRNHEAVRVSEGYDIGGVFFSWVLHFLDKQKRSASPFKGETNTLMRTRPK